MFDYKFISIIFSKMCPYQKWVTDCNHLKMVLTWNFKRTPLYRRSWSTSVFNSFRSTDFSPFLTVSSFFWFTSLLDNIDINSSETGLPVKYSLLRSIVESTDFFFTFWKYSKKCFHTIWQSLIRGHGCELYN